MLVLRSLPDRLTVIRMQQEHAPAVSVDSIFFRI